MPNEPAPPATEAPATAVATSGPTLEPGRREALIRAVAHSMFEKRGGEHGHDLDDWLAAEHEVDALISAGAALPA